MAPLAGISPPPLNLLGNQDWYRFATTQEYVDELTSNPATVNSGMLVGHTTIRVSVMDRLDRPVTEREVLKMEKLVDAAMQAGISGFSTGLEYPLAIAASE